MFYPAKFHKETDGVCVITFRDIPEAITQGDDEKDAMEMAGDALISAFDFYFEDKRIIPAPSKLRHDEHLIEVPPSIAAKVLLLNEMLIQKVKPIDLARRMSIKPQEVHRLIDLAHNTKIDTINLALAALGKHLELQAV